MLTIVTALRAEAEPLIKALPETEVIPCGPGSLRRYTDFHLLRCGMGKQKAIASLNLYLDQFNPRTVLLMGFAGALNHKFKIGQLFRITTVMNAQTNNFFDLSVYNPFQQLPGARLLTVPQAVTTEGQKQDLRKRFKADLVDMEAFHLAQICFRQNIQFGAIKGVTDLAGPQAGNEFKQNHQVVALKIFEILRPLLKIEP